MNYDEYRRLIQDDLEACLDAMGVQPILFFGSGMSQRYIGTPTWYGLLEILAATCPKIDKKIAYYKQKHDDPIKIGTEFSELIREWAWEEQEKFPQELFEGNQPSNIYIKHIVSEIFQDSSTTAEAQTRLQKYENEIRILKSINPYAIITTNYDSFLENTFPDYAPIIGQEILRANYASVGEIIKIHGCSSSPRSLVLTSQDYEDFGLKKKYLSAKLLTFFAEHPLIILGYSAQDPNIRTILSDIDEILAPEHELIPNIYLVEWDENAENTGQHALEKLIPIDHEKSVRVKSIKANSFDWIYETLSSNEAIRQINPKLLRSVLARTYKLVRHDIPKKTIEVDFQILEHAVSTDDEFAKLYGITTLDDPSSINATYPYSLSNVAKELGFNYWHFANEIIKKLEEIHGKNLKSSDNKYHIAIKSGEKIQAHKYSQAAVDLFRKVMQGEEYTFDI
ncbi:SIR2 family protein [Thalassolituus pacificus]|uniref:SIR2 family protein n=1 Tax=Thalassolituus pacificus TaxID=2975440 RepID=A0A9X2WBY1_9GAMM|nr:SIR2 family protein [Thalassolituus pacificus]MCT7357555.1 SIR2 family protein [Thalassolituus pacificus]